MRTAESTFGLLVKQYIQAHELSYQDLVSSLGYKSKTSITRIVQDATSYKLRLEFYQRFCERYALTAEEKEAFDSQLNLSRMDEEQQKLSLSLRRFFSKAASGEAVRCIHSAAPAVSEPLQQILRQRASGTRQLTAYVMGWCSLPLLCQLHHTLHETGRSFTIRHLLPAEGSPQQVLELLSGTASFLFDPRYVLYHVPKNDEMVQMNHLTLLHCEYADGTAEDDLLIQLDREQCLFQPMQTTQLSRTAADLITLLQLPSVKSDMPGTQPPYSLETLIHQQKLLFEMEENRAVYSYCKEFDLSLIPPEIFSSTLSPAALRDHPAECRELCSIQQKRYENIRIKRSPSYFILTTEALKNFVWTGRLKSHPHVLNTFSSKDRMLVLNALLTAQAENPFFFVRLAADTMPSLWNHLSLRCCRHMKRASSHGVHAQKDVLALFPASAVQEESTLLPLTDPELVSSFASYYMSELWEKCTRSRKECLETIHTILHYHNALSTY
ncbi:MAG: hypothetical protein IKU70_13780 [Clostridia bacterium]|nr:hypothetical protein [Clostridia bacterium]